MELFYETIIKASSSPSPPIATRTTTITKSKTKSITKTKTISKQQTTTFTKPAFSSIPSHKSAHTTTTNAFIKNNLNVVTLIKRKTTSETRVAFLAKSSSLLQRQPIFDFHSNQLDEWRQLHNDHYRYIHRLDHNDHFDNHVIHEMQQQNENILLTLNLTKKKFNLIKSIESLTVRIVDDVAQSGNARLKIINRCKWENFYIDEVGIMRIKTPNESLIYETVHYKWRGLPNRRFAMIFYTLDEIHKILLTKGSASNREMYYRNPGLVKKQSNIDNAILDVSFLLRKATNEFSIYSSAKGLIAGDLCIYLTNGNVIECHNPECAALLSGEIITNIEKIVTTAKYVLLVEKDTVFRKLISLKILSKYQLILVTGKGYPDQTTRYIIHYFATHCHLPVYALFDSDPFGIEIMLIYRHGSRAMAFNNHNLACPQLLWLGVHPSEIDVLNIPTLPLQPTDLRRISSLMHRSYLSQAIRHELSILLKLKRKAPIEAVVESLVHDYIPNKMTRNLII